MPKKTVIRQRITERINMNKERLALYLAKEKEILEGGVQAYGIGDRNLTRYNADLKAVRDAIEEIREQIDEDEDLLDYGHRRAARAVVPREW